MTNWSQFPSDVRGMIVQRCTQQDRNSLKSTCYWNKQVVEKLRLNVFDYLTLSKHFDGKYEILIGYPQTTESTIDDIWKRTKYDTFEELQNALTDILKSTHCIRNLRVTFLDHEVQLEHWNNGYRQRMMVEHVNIQEKEGKYMKHVLSQVEPIYLKTISILYGDDCTIYDMPQVVSVDSVSIIGPAIREDQLLKLNPRFIQLFCELPYSLKNFVEKCTSRETSNITRFELSGSKVFNELKELYPPTPTTDSQLESDKIRVLLETSDPRQKLELYFNHYNSFNIQCWNVTGTIRYESERAASAILHRDQTVLRAIEQLDVEFLPLVNVWKVKVLRKHHDYYIYELKSIGEFCERLNEVLENVDCIKIFKVHLQGSPPLIYDKNLENKIKWAPRDNKLLVRYLSVYGNHSITSVRDLLDQIDSNHLETLTIKSVEVDETLFDLPQIYNNLARVSISGSVLRPDQLAKMNAVEFISGDKNDGNCQNELLTAADINQYIKKFLLTRIKKWDDCIWFYNISPTVEEEDVLEGFNIIATEIVTDGKGITIDYGHSTFVLALKYGEKGIFGYRTLRTEAKGFFKYLSH